MAEYLEGAFAMITEKHGSIDSYLAEVLGVDAGLKARLAEKLIET